MWQAVALENKSSLEVAHDNIFESLLDFPDSDINVDNFQLIVLVIEKLRDPLRDLMN
jgi:hypothetical protein